MRGAMTVSRGASTGTARSLRRIRAAARADLVRAARKDGLPTAALLCLFLREFNDLARAHVLGFALQLVDADVEDVLTVVALITVQIVAAHRDATHVEAQTRRAGTSDWHKRSGLISIGRGQGGRRVTKFVVPDVAAVIAVAERSRAALDGIAHRTFPTAGTRRTGRLVGHGRLMGENSTISRLSSTVGWPSILNAVCEGFEGRNCLSLKPLARFWRCR
jgi:hypothetical protein